MIERGSGFKEIDVNKKSRELAREIDLHLFNEVLLDELASDKMRHELIKILKDEKRYIDRGGAGIVYGLSGLDADICIKVVEDRAKSKVSGAMDLGNPVDVEARFQNIFSGVTIGTARAPKCFGYWLSPEGAAIDSGIVMEQLDAINLEHILSGYKDAVLPAGFNYDSFTDSLTDYIEFMHNKGVIHNDIAARNFMVDRKTGHPRVIDFGRAKSISRFSEDEQYSYKEEDWKELDKVFERLGVLDENNKI